MANYFSVPLVLALFPAVYAAFSLYAPSGLTPVAELRRAVLATGLVSLSLTAGVFLSKETNVYSRGAFLLSSALIAFLVPLFRSLLRSACAARPWWGVPVLILGAGKTASLLIHTLKTQPELGFKPVACLDDDPAKLGLCSGVPVAGPLSLAPRLASQLRISHAILAMPGVPRDRLVHILEHHTLPFSRLLVIPNLFGLASLWVSTLDLSGVLGLEVRQNLLTSFNRAWKRCLDCLLAVPLLAAALPLMAASALWVRLASRGRPLFPQRRLGEREAPLRIWKLRTMHPHAEAILDRHLSSNPDARLEWNRFFKLRNDPRVIPGIGRFLRRTSLDELPQLWNVLKGEMSLVGPRPLPQYHLDQFTPEFRALRARVKPGLTGLWQVSARSTGDHTVLETLDTYYIRNWSLWLDLYILARTVQAVIRGKGAY
jgi:Undecaprenyl-phosphate galactose phosphotransferase WbaP